MVLSGSMLYYTPKTFGLEIKNGGMDISGTKEWRKCQIRPYIFHLKHATWKDFFWEVNTDEKMVWKITGTKFCKKGGVAEKLNIKVISEGGTTKVPPRRFRLLFGETKIVPMGMPPVPESLEIGTKAVELCRDLGLTVKVIGSTDLTHYGVNYGFVTKGSGPAAVDWVRNSNDRRIIAAMQDMAPKRVIDEALAQHNACCSGAAATAIAAVKALGARCAETLAYATSYDRSPGDSFVGYVGMVFS